MNADQKYHHTVKFFLTNFVLTLINMSDRKMQKYNTCKIATKAKFQLSNS